MTPKANATPLAPSVLAQQVNDLSKQVAELKSQRVTYMQAPVTAVNQPASTFTAQVSAQTDGATVSLAGIASPAQFLPVVGNTVTIALQGAQPIYQPAIIAPGAVTPVEVSPNAPAAPAGLTLSASSTLTSSGAVQGQVTATWTAPTLTAGGSALAGTLTYSIQFRVTGSATWTTQTATTTTALIPAASGLSYDVQVAAVDQVGNVGAYTAVSTIVAGKDTVAPAAPTTPTVGSYLGQLQVTWNGALTSGAVPADFAYIEVHVSATSGFTPSTSTLVSQLSAAGSAFATAPYGTTTFAKLIAVDFSGNKSAASTQASGATSQVVGADILAGAVAATQLANLSVSTAKLVDASVIQAKIGTGAVGNSQLASLAVQTANIADAAIVTAKIADLAVNTAKIGNLAVGTAQMADLSVATAKIADAAVVNAKIGSLAVNDAQVGSIAAGKITAGTMSAAVTISGRIATALTGARTEMNSLGFQKFDSSGNLIVSITGTDTLLQGNFKTATTGRRIEIGASGSTGSIDYYAPSGKRAYVQALTESWAPNHESLQMSLDVGGHALYNAINIDDIPQIRVDSFETIICFPAGGDFQVLEYNSSANFSTGIRARLAINDTALSLARSNGGVVIQLPEGFADDRVIFTPNGLGTGNGALYILDNLGDTLTAPRINFLQSNADGTVLKSYNAHVEVRGFADTTFAAIWASAFTVSSDAGGKTNIQDANIDAVSKVRGLRVRSYQRTPPGQGQPLPPPEIGLIAQEAPPEIVTPGPGSDGQLGIGIYQYTTLLAAALQQLDTRVTTLEQRKGPPSP